ncbi:MAG: hypothetical protein JNM72_11355 [Deltaproteobacteria bacterium]|nr:hypothetical protein [Deltaproteobacteria bacterium]
MHTPPWSLRLDPHPLLALAAATVCLPGGGAGLPAARQAALRAGLQPTPAAVEARTKTPIRALLRAGGHDPSGRGRPAHEALHKAVSEGRLGPEAGVHALVDLANALSLAHGLPVSLLRPAPGPLRVRLGRADEAYTFNPAGQVLGLRGLLLVEDDLGPAGSPVKDSQRTKASAEDDLLLLVVWGSQALPGAAAALVVAFAAALPEGDVQQVDLVESAPG